MTFTKMDVTRLGKNFGCVMQTLPKLQECQCVNAGKAVIEHHFDCHEFCGDWCTHKIKERLNVSRINAIAEAKPTTLSFATTSQN